jgi:cyclic pyranopterin phosphate synthase
MKDRFGREIDYLRVSVTDRCNFRCLYCLPSPITLLPLLSYEEILNVVRASVSLGIKKFRITGGEPLVRRDIIYFLKEALSIKGVEKVSLTTNGYLLGDFARELSNIGLHSINVSINSLDRNNFQKITGVDGLKKVIEGIKQLLDLGFGGASGAIKINTVLLKNYNEDEVLEFARITQDYTATIRFIEYMPCGNWETSSGNIINGDEIIKQISEKVGELVRISDISGSGPARYYRLKDSNGKIGFILPVSQPFCAECNRLRLTADGYLKSCLLSDNEIDIKHILRETKDERRKSKEIEEVIIKAILNKPLSHSHKRNALMSRIGG